MSTVAVAGPRLLRLIALFASIVVLAVIFAGCSSSAEDVSHDAPAAGGADAGGDGDGDGEDMPQGGDSPGNRSIIVTGSMYITVENPLQAADKAAALVKGAGGRVDARGETAPDADFGGAAELTLRIPTSRLDAVVEDLRTLGTVDEFTTTSSDVTNEVTDLDARISTLRASTARIEALLTDATSISDIIKLEDELASRQAELESLEAEQRGLNDQVSLSTIHLSLTTVPVEIEQHESRATFFDGFAAGWNGLVNFVSVGLVVLGALLPWLALFGIITIAIVAAVRMRRARAAASAAQAAQPSESAPAAQESNAT